MSAVNKTRPKSLVLTYIAVFAALNALSDFIPFTPILGVPGASLRFGWVSSSLTGILLGAKIGGLSCLIGGLIGFFLGQPQIFGPFTPLRPAISASIAGMLISKHWRVPAITLLTLISVWLSLPTGRYASVIVIFHITGLALVLLLREKIGDLARSKFPKESGLGLFLVSYCGNITRHLFGNIILATIQDLQFIYFISATPITFMEQLTFATGTMILGLSLSRLGSNQQI